MASEGHVGPPADDVAGRRTAIRRTIGNRGKPDRQAGPGGRLQQGRPERKHIVPSRTRPFRKHHDPPAPFHHLLDLPHDTRDVALVLSLDEQGVHRRTQPPDHRPVVDVGLGHEDAVKLRSQQDDVDVAQMIRNQEERRRRWRALDLDSHPQQSGHGTAPGVEDPGSPQRGPALVTAQAPIEMEHATRSPQKKLVGKIDEAQRDEPDDDTKVDHLAETNRRTSRDDLRRGPHDRTGRSSRWS